MLGNDFPPVIKHIFQKVAVAGTTKVYFVEEFKPLQFLMQPTQPLAFYSLKYAMSFILPVACTKPLNSQEERN